LLRRIEAMGGAVAAIERGFIQGEIQESAYRQQLAVERGARVVVGVNRYPDSDAPPVEIAKLRPAQQATQVEAVRKLRARRDAAAVRARLLALQEAARGTENLLPPMKQALAAYATVGEVCDTLRAVFGEYRAEQTA
jgi:methylmalonyl-CoA mutase N-terminal domain/subunit